MAPAQPIKTLTMPETSSILEPVMTNTHAVISSRSTDHVGKSMATAVVLGSIAFFTLITTLCACVFLLRDRTNQKQAVKPSSPTVLGDDTWSSTITEPDGDQKAFWS